jgi:site-specific DNA-methyltransferase (adenine-specific)
MKNLNTVIYSDNIKYLKTLPENFCDSIVTDPPYGLKFMGKKWDYDVPSVKQWSECLRVLKPGGHVLSFSGTRTQHRMACNIEDAGFEIRDMLAWIYGSGFPKSLNIGKAIDKKKGKERKITGQHTGCGIKSSGGSKKRNIPKGYKSSAFSGFKHDIPATPEAERWDGWGTALKPAMEPITLARKPIKGTIADNVMEYGVGGLNINGCRVPSKQGEYDIRHYKNEDCFQNKEKKKSKFQIKSQPTGRFPANIIHDGSDEVEKIFPGKTSGKPCGRRNAENNIYGKYKTGLEITGFGDNGSASRFFYVSKADKKERGEYNNHPTVKPIDLIRYLCRLITPPGGIIIDPWGGSGTTGIASYLEGFNFIVIDNDIKSVGIARQRIREYMDQGKLF